MYCPENGRLKNEFCKLKDISKPNSKMGYGEGKGGEEGNLLFK